jgi:hypothetical protein
MQLLIGERPDIGIRFALPDKGSFVLAGCLEVAVKAVIGYINFPADKVPYFGFIFEVIDFVFIPLLEPFQLPQNLSGSLIDS